MTIRTLYNKLVKLCYFSRSLVFPLTATYATLSKIIIARPGGSPFGCGPATLWSVAIINFIFIATASSTMAAKDDPSIGRHLYYSYCAVCHGQDATGNGPLAEKLEIEPPDLTSDDYQKKSIEELTEIISKYEMELEATTMPKWGEVIPKSNLRHISAFIPMLTQTDLRLRGDVRRGELIFNRTCVPCHGPRGKGNGVIIKILNVKKMADFTNVKTLKRKTDESILEIIKKGSSDEDTYMPPWDGILGSDDIINVGAYVRSLRK